MNWFKRKFESLFKRKNNKKIEKDNNKFRELYARLNYLIRDEGKNKSEAQLEILEEFVKQVEVDRKKIIDTTIQLYLFLFLERQLFSHHHISRKVLVEHLI